MEKKELYRVKKGKLISKDIEIPFDFGLVFDNDGFIYTDFYVPETFDLNQFCGISVDDDFPTYDAFCVTDSGNVIEIRGLDFKTISPSKCLVEMICYGSLTYIKERLPHPDDKENDETLHYLELEGLQMEYCEATKYERNSRMAGSLGAPKYIWDRTTIGWSTNFSAYNLDFSKNHENGNVIVKFDNSVNSIQTLSTFKELKKDFLSIISFLSGAQVKIRKECFGNYYSLGTAEAEKQITYSFRRIVTTRSNQYIPLNNPFINRSANILRKVMIQNFDKFKEWNAKIDLSSVIHYLNGAVQTKTLEEQFFILIIAFERLTTLYAEQTGPKDLYNPTKEDYQPIKSELFAVLEKHKTQFGDSYTRAKSIIGSLNHVQRLSTKDKMFGIINDVGIELTDELTDLIDTVRNEAVHKGNIGQNLDGYKNTVLLNELIHEIILRLIKYLGPRKSTFLFGKTVMTIDTPVTPALLFERQEPLPGQ